MTRRVWVLGAGFSRPLGGPLLSELMRPEVRTHLDACYPRQSYPKLADKASDAVLFAYGYGSKFKDGRPVQARHADGEAIWSDAEQFLDFLDAAAYGGENSPALYRLEYILARGLDDQRPSRFGGSAGALRLYRAAKRLVAGSCSAFLMGADPISERWEPFLKWARGLNEDDTIISFNYDLVVETLNSITQNIHIALPQELSRPGKATLLKLHGSVNWCAVGAPRDGSGVTGKETVTINLVPEQDIAMKCEDHELAIACPGPTKRAVSSGWLAPLWEAAEHAIRKASAIVFVGYRFPPSDSYARERLLSAIQSNKVAYLATHCVLGTNSPQDNARMKQLLRFSLTMRREIPYSPGPFLDLDLKTGLRYNLVVHPLFGEDFLSVFPMGWLTQGWMIQPS